MESDRSLILKHVLELNLKDFVHDFKLSPSEFLSKMILPIDGEYALVSPRKIKISFYTSGFKEINDVIKVLKMVKEEKKEPV